MMRGTCKSFAIVCLMLLAACTAAAPAGVPAANPAASRADAHIDNVILFIVDGAGTAYWSAAKFAQDSLAVATMPVVGLVDTRSSDSRVTDSAAGATVYATGQRTYNGAIGVGPRCAQMFRADSAAVMRNPAACDPLETVLQVAKARGMATGLVATSSVTHATPASFAAHVPYRRMQPEIAAQLATAELDVLLGGGLGFFDGRLRPDGQNLHQEMCRRATCLTQPAELRGYRADDRPLVGLFAEEHLERALERREILPQMTRTALEKLSRHPRGFFVMIEPSQPDWRGHDNEPIEELINEMLDADRAIAVALDFARRDGRTLVVVTADHETGGFSIAEQNGQLRAQYGTDYHTGEMVPLFAYGPGAERFGGIKENYQVGRLLMEIVRARR